MPRRSLFKYFYEEKYAEAFLDGQLLFRALSYFRDVEDGNVRGDESEGQSKYRPETGLQVNNLSQKTSFVLKEFSFTSRAKQDEIFILCLSAAHADSFYDAFQAEVCIEVTDVGAFCDRVQGALPDAATFPAVQSGRPRIGNKVEYYDEMEGGTPRWALPDMIAISKLRRYAWQQEFRLVFSVIDAFRFENVATRLTHDDHRDVPGGTKYPQQLITAASVRDIAKLRRRPSR